MFSFLTSGTKDTADPLVAAKSVAAWLHHLPTLDVVGRQQQVMRAFEGMRQSIRPIDLARAQALEYLDAALGGDRRQLIKQYVENIDTNPKLAERIWLAIFELTQGFITAYQATLEEALAHGATSRWKPAVPMLFTRLLHYYGTDAKLRVFRFERWIPAKWMEVHRAFLRATEIGVEKSQCTLGAAGPNAMSWTPELEYLNVLLVHQLNTGNLSPGGLDWACSQLRAWSRRLALDDMPRSPEGFFVDLAGKSGLVRRTGNDSGSMLRYVDTTPLAEQLDRALSSLRQAEGMEHGPTSIINQQRVVVLEKTRPAISPNFGSDLRKDARIACAVPARVRIGLPRICRELGAVEGSGIPDNQPGEQIEVFAVSDSPRVKRRPPPDEHDSLAASLQSFSDPMWQVKDRSVAGLRIAASGGIGQSLALGVLVAVRQSDVSDWVLGVVRRLNKVSNDDVEAGVSIIAERVVPVPLHAKREVKDDTGFVVNGLDTSTVGARFDGLYLPPPSRPDKPLSVKTLIVPTHEYSDGRHVVLVTGRSIYTVALRHLVEQRAEWSWCAIQILEKKPRA
jgi:hypothetical protein